MFLVKVNAHRGDLFPANEEADIQADKVVPGINVPTEWLDRTNGHLCLKQEFSHGKSLAGKKVR